MDLSFPSATGNRLKAQENLSELLPSIQEKQSFWTARRIALTALAGSALFYIIFHRRSYSTDKEFGEGLGNTLKTAYTKACELKGGTAFKVMNTIDEHLKDAPAGYGMLRDRALARIGFPNGASGDTWAFTNSSSLAENGLFTKEYVYKILPWCREFPEMGNTGCDADYEGYINRAINMLQRDCDSQV